MTSKTAYKNSVFYPFLRPSENRDFLTMALLGRLSQKSKIPHFYDLKFYFDSEFSIVSVLPSPKLEIPFWDFCIDTPFFHQHHFCHFLAKNEIDFLGFEP